MWYSKARIVVIASGLAVVLLTAPSQSEGGLCDWLCPSSWCPPAPSTTTYAPPYSVQRVSLMPVVGTPCTVSACSPVMSACSYVPYTTYRWRYSRMPITTSYRPVSAVDPCTGCVTTSYQPVTRFTLLPWLHREPVTSYRVDCSGICAPTCTTSCYPSCTTSCYPSCGVSCYSSCMPSCYSGGVVGTVQTVPGSSCGSGCAPITTIPRSGTTSGSTDSGYGDRTFKDSSGSTGTSDQGTSQPDVRLKPAPELEGNPASIRRPASTDPENKTASLPIRYALYHPLVKKKTPTSTPSSPPLDVSGWRASRD